MITEKRLGTATLILLNILLFTKLTIETKNVDIFIINTFLIIYYLFIGFTYIQMMFLGKQTTSIPVLIFFTMLMHGLYINTKVDILLFIVIIIISLFGFIISFIRSYKKHKKKFLKKRFINKKNIIDKELNDEWSETPKLIYD